jgi:outer membrane protein assembly factor BamE (lipoprotein component of BamABCDE complex)
MKYIFLFILFFFTINCSVNKVSDTHGFRFLETKTNKILINKTNKNDVKKLIGPPSSVSSFNDIWLYIERKKTNQSIYKLGKKKISKNNILILEFNSMGLVSSKKLLKLENMNDIKIAEKVTNKKFKNDNRIYDILSTLRNKLNTTRQKK